MGVDDAGLPRAVQVAAAFGMERRLLEIAFEFERVRPWADQYPPLMQKANSTRA